MGVWVSSAKTPSRCRYGQSNKGRTCHGSEGRPEPPSPRQGSLDALCSGRAPSHPTSLILGFCPPPPPPHPLTHFREKLDLLVLQELLVLAVPR